MVSVILMGGSTLAGIDVSSSESEPAPFAKYPLLQNDVYDMAVITSGMFSSALQPLIEHKNNRGLATILITLDDIYNSNYFPVQGRDDAEKVKYFIKDAIDNWGIKYVMLVGGAEQFPGRYTHIYYNGFNLYPTPDEWIFLSDLYYADIYDSNGNFSSWDSNGNDVFGEYDWHGNTDEVDLYPDVYLGRLACINENEVVTYVNKIIAYETGETGNQDWFANIVAIGGDSLPGDVEQIDEGEYVQKAVFAIMDGFSQTKIWASEGKLNQVSNINDAIDNGASFVFFNGHGNTDLWGTHPHENENMWLPPGFYRNSNIDALSNGNKLPIVISDACYHCKYDIRSDCFGWSFITNPNGGAIAFLGGTDIDLSYGGKNITTKGVEKLCLALSTHYIEGTKTFGELWGKSLATYISTATMDQIDYITIEESQPFGDPSLMIQGYSQPPEKPDRPNGVGSGKTRTGYTYTTSTTDPDQDDIYYLFDWGDGTDSGWKGPYNSGDEMNATHIWTNTGNYEIKVKAKDEYGMESEWSDSLPVTMPFTHQTMLEKIMLWILKIFGMTIP